MKLDNVSGYKVYNVYNTLIRYTKYILKLKDGKLLNKKEAINLHKPIKLDNVSGYKVYNVYNKIHKLYSYKLKLKDGWLLIILIFVSSISIGPERNILNSSATNLFSISYLLSCLCPCIANIPLHKASRSSGFSISSIIIF